MEELLVKLRDLTECIATWKVMAEKDKVKGINSFYLNKGIEMATMKRDAVLAELESRFMRLRNLREKN